MTQTAARRAPGVAGSSALGQRLPSFCLPMLTWEQFEWAVLAQTPSKRLKSLARPERLELPTLGFEDRYSIQLSYGRANAPALARSAERGGSARPRACSTPGARKLIFFLTALSTSSGVRRTTVLVTIAPLSLTANEERGGAHVVGKLDDRIAVNVAEREIHGFELAPELREVLEDRLAPARPAFLLDALGAFGGVASPRTDISAWRPPIHCFPGDPPDGKPTL